MMKIVIDPDELMSDLEELEDELEYLIKRSIQQKKDIEETQDVLDSMS